MCLEQSPSFRHSPSARVAFLVLLALGPGGAQALAGQSADPREGDAVVASVTEVSGHAATYANPPRVKLQVREVLQGDPKTDRRQALWAPPPHDIDTGTVTDDPRYKAWAAKQMDGPAVGSRWILYGSSYASDPARSPVFYVSSQAAVPFSEQNLAAAVKAARERSERRRKLAEEADADQRANARIKALWRTSVGQQDLDRYAAEADLVVTARWVGSASAADAIGVRITSVLKGTLRELPGKQNAQAGATDERPRHIDFPAGPALQVLMDRDTEYLLFLSDQGVTFSHVSPCYPRIRTGDGAVIADELALQEVRDALRRAGAGGKAAPGAVDEDRADAPAGS
jgi:hypothetical protein